MQALLFLTQRSIVNGVRRAFTSGKRLITLIFMVAYYAFLVFRPMGSSSQRPLRLPILPTVTPMLVDEVCFIGFAFLSLMLSLTMLAPRGGFRQADVDVLFATPISPRIVMFFRMIRDYLATLLSPLLILVFGGRRLFVFVQAFAAGMHADAALMGQMASLAWFLMALAWVCVTYGVGLLVNRSDLGADRNKKLLDSAIVALVFGTVLYIILGIVRHPTLEGAQGMESSTAVRMVFFSATAANWMVGGAMNGQPLFIALGASVLIATAALGIALALSQVQFMYDQAAVKGFGAVERRMLQRSNDFYGLSAQRAKEGNFRIGRLSRWFGRLRVTGAPALMWKEALLQLRAAPFLYFFFGALQLLMMVLPILIIRTSHGRDRTETAGPILLLMQGFGVLMNTMNSAVSGFIELLKRVDFQKPLPFRPAGTVFWEIASKCVPNALVGALGVFIVTVLAPTLWGWAIASEVLVIGLGLVISATVFLVTVAFSDAGDASQRGFRGILILLGIVICCSPGVGTLVLLLSVFHLNPLLAVLPATIFNVVIAGLLSFIGGTFYASFNPGE